MGIAEDEGKLRTKKKAGMLLFVVKRSTCAALFIPNGCKVIRLFTLGCTQGYSYGDVFAALRTYTIICGANNSIHSSRRGQQSWQKNNPKVENEIFGLKKSYVKKSGSRHLCRGASASREIIQK